MFALLFTSCCLLRSPTDHRAVFNAWSTEEKMLTTATLAIQAAPTVNNGRAPNGRPLRAGQKTTFLAKRLSNAFLIESRFKRTP